MKNKNIFVFTCFLLLSSSTYGMEVAQKSDNYQTNAALLNRTPHVYWDEAKPKFHWGLEEPKGGRKTMGTYIAKGSASIMPYYIKDHQPYVLLSRETWGENKGKYCDLGGAVDVSGDKNTTAHASTFLETLVAEGMEESGHMYHFDKEDILKNASLVSLVHADEGYYKGFESVMAFHKVAIAYPSSVFLEGANTEVKKRQLLNLCTWCYQEKDDYQWIKWKKMLSFVRGSQETTKTFKNIEGERVSIPFRSYFIKMLRHPDVLSKLELLPINSTSW